ncbi:MAG: MerR family transcriptional regulator [Chloroflexi bacterium]|nr:MerR family transcriptional regulator [Chloroflexota bacterium]
MGMMSTREIIRMANALGIEIDYSTMRFWQKRGLIPKPVRGPVRYGRGSRGYYDTAVIERLGFIREIQKTYSLGLNTIREELDRIDRRNAESGSADKSKPFRERLEELQQEHEAETKQTILAIVARAMGVAPNDIASVMIRKKDGQTVRFLTE